MRTNGKALGELKTVTYIVKPSFFASKSRAVSLLSRVFLVSLEKHSTITRPPLAFGVKTVDFCVLALRHNSPTKRFWGRSHGVGEL